MALGPSQSQNYESKLEKRPFQSVSRRMIKAILIISGLVTTLLTAISFYLDYSQEMDLLEKTLIQIEKASVSNLVDSIWQMDSVQIKTTLEGIEGLNDIVRVELVDEEGTDVFSKGDESSTEEHHKIVRTFPLVFDQAGEQTNVGTLKVIATREFIMEKIKQRVIVFFITQAAKTFLVSFLILLFTGWLITSQIVRISTFFEKFDPNNLKEERLIRAYTRGYHTDEIDNLIENINKMASDNLNFTRQIKKANELLEEKVAARTKELFQKQEDTLAILNSLHQGIMTLGSKGIIGSDYSVFMCKLLEKQNLEGLNGIDLLFKGSELPEDDIAKCQSAIEICIGEGSFEFEINDHCFPKVLNRQNTKGELRRLELDWIPITDNENLIQKMLLSIRDVTEINKLKEEAAKLEKEKKCMIELLTCDKNQLHFFCQDSISILDAFLLAFKEGNSMENQMDHLMRQIHTIKGNSRTFGLSFVTNLAHQFESGVKHQKEKIDSSVYNKWIKDLGAIRNEIEFYQYIAENKIFHNTKNRVQLSEKESVLLKKILFEEKNTQDLRSGLEKVLKPVLFQSTLSSILGPAIEAAPSLANQLNKPAPIVKINDGYHEFDLSSHQTLANIFGHLINNSMDHGIELPDDRVAKGKPPEGRIIIDVYEQEGATVVEFQDDGNGIDLEKVIYRLSDKKTSTPPSCSSWEEIAGLLIRSGFTTKENVTQISGRGIGLDAVLAFTEELGGSFDILPMKDWHPELKFMPVKFSFTFTAVLQQEKARSRNIAS